MFNKGIVSEEKPKPVLDEQTLAKLLEAAFVLQEHNREVQEIELGLDLKREQTEAEQKAQAPLPAEPVARREPDAAAHGDYTLTLAQIVATQHQIQIRNLELEKAMTLVAERLTEMARADGAAIGMVDGRKVRYRAVVGARALRLGTEVPVDRALCLPCIKNGQVFRCPDVNPEFLVDTEECRRRGIASLIAVPIFHEGGVVAGLELYYSIPSGFTDQDVHTCQLMAGLITEALARDEEVTWKQSLASERAMMLEALEKLKPNLAALVEPAAAKPIQSTPKNPVPSPVTEAAYFCGNCGHEMAGGERFCGQCGNSRLSSRKSAALPSSAASIQPHGDPAVPPQSRTIPEPNHPLMSGMQPDESLAEALEQQFPDLFREAESTSQSAEALASIHEPHSESPSELSLHLNQELETSAANIAVPELENALPDGQVKKESDLQDEGDENDELAIAKVPPADNWTSAAAAREFLEQVAPAKERGGFARFWETRRGDIYLAVAVILVACVIRWGIWSNRPVSATATPAPSGATVPHKAPDTDLSMFDRMLISLGLAETPEVPEDKGNPSAQVWVDLHTALYYCPGTDAYGKTPKGKFMTQRDAQLDSYEPAYRKACN